MKIDTKFLVKNIDQDKLDRYMRVPEFLGAKRAVKLSWWGFMNKPKFYYFYVLCDCGISNMFAYNKADTSTTEEIMEYIEKNHLRS